MRWPRGAWWELYGDRQLNGLIEKLNSVQPDRRAVRSPVPPGPGAWCAAPVARFSRRVDLSVGKTRSSQGTGSSSSSLTQFCPAAFATPTTPRPGVSWEADVWGKLRRGLEADKASAERALPIWRRCA